MGDRTAFFYGTLMAREVLNRVCYGSGQVGNDPVKTSLAKNLSIRPAILHGYCRHKVENADYPGIVKQEGHSVRGTYVTGLTEGDILRLDRYEGGEYKKHTVNVVVLKDESEEGGHVVCTETYVYTAGIGRLEKKEWDYAEFRRDKLKYWGDDSIEYEEEVDEVVAGVDTSAG